MKSIIPVFALICILLLAGCTGVSQKDYAELLQTCNQVNIEYHSVLESRDAYKSQAQSCDTEKVGLNSQISSLKSQAASAQALADSFENQYELEKSEKDRYKALYDSTQATTSTIISQYNQYTEEYKDITATGSVLAQEYNSATNSEQYIDVISRYTDYVESKSVRLQSFKDFINQNMVDLSQSEIDTFTMEQNIDNTLTNMESNVEIMKDYLETLEQQAQATQDLIFRLLGLVIGI